MAKTWFISDTHFGHANIIRYCNRPFKDVHHMDEVLIANWNDVVAPGDTVWHLGDFALGDRDAVTRYCLRLNGIIRLIKGNHDRIQRQGLQQIFGAVAHDMNVHLEGRLLHLTHSPWLRERPRASLVLHGHVHGRPTGLFGFFDCSVERIGYRPVSLEEVLKP